MKFPRVAKSATVIDIKQSGDRLTIHRRVSFFSKLTRCFCRPFIANSDNLGKSEPGKEWTSHWESPEGNRDTGWKYDISSSSYNNKNWTHTLSIGYSGSKTATFTFNGKQKLRIINHLSDNRNVQYKYSSGDDLILLSKEPQPIVERSFDRLYPEDNGTPYQENEPIPCDKLHQLDGRNLIEPELIHFERKYLEKGKLYHEIRKEVADENKNRAQWRETKRSFGREKTIYYCNTKKWN